MGELGAQLTSAVLCLTSISQKFRKCMTATLTPGTATAPSKENAKVWIKFGLMFKEAHLGGICEYAYVFIIRWISLNSVTVINESVHNDVEDDLL